MGKQRLSRRYLLSAERCYIWCSGIRDSDAGYWVPVCLWCCPVRVPPVGYLEAVDGIRMSLADVWLLIMLVWVPNRFGMARVFACKLIDGDILQPRCILLMKTSSRVRDTRDVTDSNSLVWSTMDR